MAGREFLNPYVKIALCGAGLAIMGYCVYPTIKTGGLSDSVTIIRALVFVGFAYLLVRSIKQLLRPVRGDDRT